jgi:hypothetical protein
VRHPYPNRVLIFAGLPEIIDMVKVRSAGRFLRKQKSLRHQPGRNSAISRRDTPEACQELPALS